MNPAMPEDFDYSASISSMDVREWLPSIDPDNLSASDVLEILLYLFKQKPGFIDRGHELNNRETAWVNAYLFRLKPHIDDNGLEGFWKPWGQAWTRWLNCAEPHLEFQKRQVKDGTQIRLYRG